MLLVYPAPTMVVNSHYATLGTCLLDIISICSRSEPNEKHRDILPKLLPHQLNGTRLAATSMRPAKPEMHHMTSTWYT